MNLKAAHALPWHEYAETLKPHERPMMPGSPASPDHPVALRLAYAGVGALVAVTGGFGAAFVTANTPQLAGALGVTTTEAAWLPVVYVMTNACMNLLLVKFRTQYGMQLFTKIILSIFVAVAIGNLFVDDFRSALLTRAVAGICGAGMSTLGILYMIQAFPAAHRLKGLIIGIGLSSFALPIARIASGHLLDLGQWRAIHALELGLALMSLAAVFALKMPPAERLKVYEKLDFLTFALFASGIALLCAVLGLGRIVWWTETAWVGWALAGSIALLAGALIVEHRRKTPLINLRWISGADIIRLALSILLVRVVLSEQTSGAVGFLQQMGLGPDQLHGLFWIVLAATAAGTLVSALTLNPAKLWAPIAASLALIAVGAFLDSRATVLTRPENVYFSQGLLAFASALFIGPALMIGVAQVMQKGFQNMVSFIVVFSVGQNVGGLAGSALVGTVQVVREKFHDNQLADGIAMGDPDVLLRLQQLTAAYGKVVGDASLRSVEGLRALQQQVTQQANVLAYNDVFLIIAVLAAIGAAWTAFVHIRPRLSGAAAPSPAAPASPAAATATAE
jgi:hypothetical protein